LQTSPATYNQYNSIYVNFNRIVSSNSRKIIKLNIDVYQPEFERLLSNDDVMKLIRTILYIVLFFIFVLLINCLIVSDIKSLAALSLNMLRILPTEIINRNQ
jgi:hypothetical protein